MNIWNTICSDLTNEKLRQATEKDYQSKVFTHFYYLLGWYSERVEQQYQQRVGSNVQYVYPDIVFFANNEKLFVIEMKQPNHIQTKEDIEQLSSYMKLLPVQFGIYIGEHIELYYKPFDCESPTSVLKIEMEADSDKGKTFVELFKRDNCNNEQLTNFCIAQIAKQEKQKEINEFINELTTEKGKQLFIELLNTKLINEGYSTEDIEKITNEIEINIIRKKQLRIQQQIQDTPLTKQHTITKNKHLDHTHYRLNGYGNYGKGRLALSIVQLFVRNNPQLTYYEIVNAIPFGIEKYSEIQKRKENSNDLTKDTRWFENDLMTSADGISFAFTTQIGRHNIGAIIDFATSQGYTVEPIK
jgi:hypothetical protein